MRQLALNALAGINFMMDALADRLLHRWASWITTLVAYRHDSELTHMHTQKGQYATPTERA